jgi:hypothetical protein
MKTPSHITATKVVEVISKSYHNCKIKGIQDAFWPRKGWQCCHGTYRTVADMAMALNEFNEAGVTSVAMIIETEYGREAQPDFSITEFLDA